MDFMPYIYAGLGALAIFIGGWLYSPDASAQTVNTSDGTLRIEVVSAQPQNYPVPSGDTISNTDNIATDWFGLSGDVLIQLLIVGFVGLWVISSLQRSQAQDLQFTMMWIKDMSRDARDMLWRGLDALGLNIRSIDSRLDNDYSPQTLTVNEAVRADIDMQRLRAARDILQTEAQGDRNIGQSGSGDTP